MSSSTMLATPSPRLGVAVTGGRRWLDARGCRQPIGTMGVMGPVGARFRFLRRRGGIVRPMSAVSDSNADGESSRAAGGSPAEPAAEPDVPSREQQPTWGGGGGDGVGSPYGGPNWAADSERIAPPSPRRVVLGVLATSGLALGGNFLGVTGKLLNGNPGFAESTRLDVIYPVNGFKRCYNPEKGYEFVYPVDYLADQTMAARNAAQREAANPLDPPPIGASAPKPPMIFGQVVQEPQSAFGPMVGCVSKFSPSPESYQR